MKSKKQFLALFLVCLTLIFSGCSVAKNVDETTTKTTTNIVTNEYTKKVENKTEKAKETTEKIDDLTTTKATEKATHKVEFITEKNTNKTTKTTKKVEKSTTKKVQKTTAVTTISSICTVEIQCKDILENMGDLKAGHTSYVPKNGVILSDYKCQYKDGNTAFDVLKKACDKNGIKLTTSDTIYGVYVVGINNLDEKDCGKYSGWKYKVNGVEPNKACDKYELNKGDSVEFFFVCTY